MVPSLRFISNGISLHPNQSPLLLSLSPPHLSTHPLVSLEKVHAHVPNSTPEDVNRAVEAAKKAFETWSTTPRAQRARILNDIADKIEERIDIFAAAESKDQGM